MIDSPGICHIANSEEILVRLIYQYCSMWVGNPPTEYFIHFECSLWEGYFEAGFQGHYRDDDKRKPSQVLQNTNSQN